MKTLNITYLVLVEKKEVTRQETLQLKDNFAEDLIRYTDDSLVMIHVASNLRSKENLLGNAFISVIDVEEVIEDLNPQLEEKEEEIRDLNFQLESLKEHCAHLEDKISNMKAKELTSKEKEELQNFLKSYREEHDASILKEYNEKIEKVYSKDGTLTDEEYECVKDWQHRSRKQTKVNILLKKIESKMFE